MNGFLLRAVIDLDIPEQSFYDGWQRNCCFHLLIQTYSFRGKGKLSDFNSPVLSFESFLPFH